MEGEIKDNIDTDIKNYTLDELLNVLEIDINKFNNYDEAIEIINEKTDNYIKFFKQSENKKLVAFFYNIKELLTGKKVVKDDTVYNETEAEKLLKFYSLKEEKKKENGLNYLNSINVDRSTVTKLLTIDSRFRNDYNNTISTDYEISLPYIIKNVLELRLSDVEFPATFYPIQDSYENNYFWIKIDYIDESNVSDTVYVYIYLESGNYYPIDLISDIQSELSALNIPIDIAQDLNFENGGGVGVGNAKTTFEYSSSTTYNIQNIELNFKASKLPSSETNYNVIHIINSNDSKIQNYYNVDSTIDYKERFGWMLGFRKNLYDGATKYVTEGQIDIIGPRYVYIILDDHNSSTNVNFFSNNGLGLLADNIIGRLSIKAYAFSVQSQNDFIAYSEPRYYYGPVDIDKLSVKIVDEFNRIVDLNGMDFSFSLQMTTKYDIRDDVTSGIRGNIIDTNDVN